MFTGGEESLEEPKYWCSPVVRSTAAKHVVDCAIYILTFQCLYGRSDN